ncbi:hypothetical protein ACF1GW_35625 [Streptomyces achromogenes]|uniref:hypothetical protein n=1 Tax=Streptomyces achromogenes TaxID=67255 RepID=UPI0036F53FF0
MIAANRTRHATLRNRARTHRAAARIRRTGTGTLATHCLARQCTRYTPAEVARIAVIYRPRKPAYRTAAARLALAA